MLTERERREYLERNIARYVAGELADDIYESALRTFGSETLVEAHRRAKRYGAQLEAERTVSLRARVLRWLGVA